jgi:hypothetical protein
MIFTAILCGRDSSWATMSNSPRTFTVPAPRGRRGRKIYIGSCTCHTQFIRNLDWGLGAERIAQAGDYIQEQPHLLGSERTRPDLPARRSTPMTGTWPTIPTPVHPAGVGHAILFWEGKIQALIAYKQGLG